MLHLDYQKIAEDLASGSVKDSKEFLEKHDYVEPLALIKRGERMQLIDIVPYNSQYLREQDYWDYTYDSLRAYCRRCDPDLFLILRDTYSYCMDKEKLKAAGMTADSVFELPEDQWPEWSERHDTIFCQVETRGGEYALFQRYAREANKIVWVGEPESHWVSEAEMNMDFLPREEHKCLN